MMCTPLSMNQSIAAWVSAVVAVGRQEELGAGRHVLDDLGNGDAVAVAHLGVDLARRCTDPR